MKSDSLEFRVIETLGHLSPKFFRTSALGTFDAGDMNSFTGGGAATVVPIQAMNSIKMTGISFFTIGASCHRVGGGYYCDAFLSELVAARRKKLSEMQRARACRRTAWRGFSCA